MSQSNQELQKCAQDVLQFFRDIYPCQGKGNEITLVQRINTLSRWIEDKSDFNSQSSSWKHGLYQYLSKAKQLRQLYEKGDIPAIRNFGESNINTLTGGWIYDCPPYSFHNDTTLNDLEQVFERKFDGSPYFDYISGKNNLLPFYQNLIDMYTSLKLDIYKIRKEIVAGTDFQKHTDEGEPGVRVRYMLEEFNRKETIIPLVINVEDLFSRLIRLSEEIIKLSK